MTQKVLTVEKEMISGYQGLQKFTEFLVPNFGEDCTVSSRESDIYVSMVKIWLGLNRKKLDKVRHHWEAIGSKLISTNTLLCMSWYNQ